MVTLLRSVLGEPRPRGARPVGAPDRVLAGFALLAVVVEGVARPDVVWRPLVTVLALAPASALLWRRTRPLAAVLVGWGVAGLLSIVELIARPGELGLSSTFVVLVLLYALLRWGSGREALAGSAFVAVVVALGMVAAATGWAEVFGGSVLVLLVAALGVLFRYRADLWHRRRREVRNAERVALARELHDTVAHHVSAIAVQAQAGGVVAATQPAKAAEVLAAIEAEASRTLAEMRSMVRVLRDEDPASLAPAPGVADLVALARPGGTPAVMVSVDPDAASLTGPVDTAAYRLAQESLTNAVRHARGATRVVIDVRRDGDVVRLRVTDDGRSDGATATGAGFGLRGMTERAALLGGTLSAGPGTPGGWVVEAVLPVEAGT